MVNQIVVEGEVVKISVSDYCHYFLLNSHGKNTNVSFAIDFPPDVNPEDFKVGDRVRVVGTIEQSFYEEYSSKTLKVRTYISAEEVEKCLKSEIPEQES